MRVSVVIPVYNVAPYVEDCLRSVLAQDYRDMEVVLVDDCGTDGSMAAARRVLGGADPPFPVRIVAHERNRGLSAARNTGLEASSGDYVYFLDSDDEITPDCIRMLVEAMGDGRPDMVVGDYRVMNSDAFFPPLRLPSGLLRGRRRSMVAYMKERIYVMAWNKLVRRDFLSENGLLFKEGLIHEDCLWSFQCACKADAVLIVKHVTYVYKVRDGSIKLGTAREKDVDALTAVLADMAGYAERQGLLSDRYVCSFIEEEKLRLLMTCQRYGWGRESFPRGFYAMLDGLPRPGLFRTLSWSFFKRRKCMRDAHYFLSSLSLREDYYWNLPLYLSLRARKRNGARFYAWFVGMLLRRFLPGAPQRPLALRS